MLLFFLLQVAILLAPFLWLQAYRVHLQVLELVLAMAGAFYLINSSMDATSRITWLLFIMPFPFFGVPLLLYTKVDLGYRGMKRMLARRVAMSQPYLKQDSAIVEKLSQTSGETYGLVRYFNRIRSSFPIYESSQAKYYPTGEAVFEDLKAELRKAKHFIFMEFFIIAEGRMWGEILAILQEKVKEGVEVRVMYDGMLEFTTLSFDYDERLQDLGIKAKSFARLSPFVSTYYNYRDHRKIVVIDNQVAFTGGFNLADEYINAIERFGYWKDTGLRVTGEAVKTFTILFLRMWENQNDSMEYADYLLPQKPLPASSGYVLPYGDSPLDHDKVGENVYISMLDHARDYVHIMTPYLILDEELAHALCFAAERGVDVSIIMPGIPDKKSAYYLAKTYFPALMQAGVKIFYFTPGFVHAKVFVADGLRAVVGTINLDYRSLYHHFECATYLYQTDCIADIVADFEETLTYCERVTLDSLKRGKLRHRLAGHLLRAIAPMM
ncbi:cardiolipin synthase [Streptococcus sp. DD12]|uniref:cardiolipin synthase n=1 Tax=Streptococcus sp. DD12 TaxID=1777880 RepID=UPI0008337C70|nr:cardiolipin synthase [Streptococcus sp. DD12]